MPALILGLGLLIVAAYFTPVTRDIVGSYDRQILDRFHRFGLAAQTRDEVVMLAIDDASQKLDTLWPEDIEASPALTAMKEHYPWPRRVWAQLLDRLIEAGAKTVFLDLVFKGPSTDPEEDRLLREALDRHKGKVILGAKFEDVIVGNAATTVLTVPTATLTDPDFIKDGRGGHLSFWGEGDVIREVFYRVTQGEAEILNAIARGEESYDALSAYKSHPGEDSIPSVGLQVARSLDPLLAKTAPSYTRIRFADPASFPPKSLHEVFVPSLWEGNFASGDAFKEKVVFVGSFATEDQDFQITPVGRIAGVQLHAHALNALMSKSFLHSASPFAFLWLTLAGVFVAWLLITFVRQPIINLFTLWGLTAVAYFICLWCFNHLSLEISPLPTILALNLCGIGGLAGNSLAQAAEKRKLHRYLVRYTSAELVDEMMRDRAGLYTMLGGVERHITVLFSDVRGFTSMSENMRPTEIVAQLNEYLSRMVECVIREKGFVDKFIGDAVMALWGATRGTPSPVAEKEDAVRAVTSALKMLAALDELNVQWRARGIPELKIGIGVHQGQATVGNIGSASPYEKMDLTVIGDTVNTASRLESITKQYGVSLVVSDVVRSHLSEDDFICRTADFVRPAGKSVPVNIFAVTLRSSNTIPAAAFTEFEAALTKYREGDFTAATAAFERAATAGLDDYLTNVYRERCRSLQQNPPENWDGVYVMTKK